MNAPPPSVGDAIDPQVVLRDGTMASLRVTRPSDHAAVRAFFHELSPESHRRRFFSMADPAETLIDTFCDSSNPRRQATFVAFRPFDSLCSLRAGAADGDVRPVAVGSYLDLGNGAAEAAFAVGDAFQANGLGTILLARLAGMAAANGFQRFEAVVLSENNAMLDVFRDSGFENTVKSARGAVTVHLLLR